MWISKREVRELSKNIREIIDGQDIDLRVSNEGDWNVLKNDIHILAKLKNEQVNVLQHDKDILKETLADISHQLNTPLTSMLIMIDLLENAPPEKQVEFIQNIKTGLGRTEWLVSTLLKMAKLEAGAVEFSRDEITFNAIIEQAMIPLQIQLEVKNQQIEVSGETELRCDKRWTAEALTNIIKNASEHSPDGATIHIESGENPISTWVSVTDCGKGLTTKQIASIFRRFEGSRTGTGYGIGLPLALAIMRGQDGDVEVASGDNNVGATFTLKFYHT
ncbi:MAG: HAMP domain-containing histidine kinase [Oscillospiraceae bacterium]|nr:HAMP domain-containing histidine kinase [Oscillospiraceae bacterium]